MKHKGYDGPGGHFWAILSFVFSFGGVGLLIVVDLKAFLFDQGGDLLNPEGQVLGC